MTTISEPLPGTVAAIKPPPAPAEQALRMVGEGVSIPDAVDRLAAAHTAEELRAAQLWWVRRVHRASWKDRRASAVLRVLERALAEVDGLVSGSDRDR